MTFPGYYKLYAWFCGVPVDLQLRVDTAMNPLCPSTNASSWYREQWSAYGTEKGIKDMWNHIVISECEAMFDLWLGKECAMTGKTRLAYIDALSDPQIELLHDLNEFLEECERKNSGSSLNGIQD